MSIYKKNTNDKYERELIDRIYNDNIDQINKIKSLLFDENKKYKLIEENRNITNQIKNYLKTYARGKKMK